MFSVFINAWKVPEVRKKILFTLGMFVIFRIGAAIPMPGINPDALAGMFGAEIFNFVDIMTGGSFKQFTVFAMGIIPYINASIIVQLLTMVVPYFEKLQKEGNEGRKKMTQYIRFGAVGFGFLEALAMSYFLSIRGAFTSTGILPIIIATITLTAGTAFLMWLGEMITENGIGNGISLIIFAGIVSRLPYGLVSIYEYLKAGTMSIPGLFVFAVMAVAVIVGVVAIQEGQRRIPVQYAKRVVGRKVYGGQSTHIPMKINQAGVIPIIFASALLTFPALIAGFFAEGNSFAAFVNKVFNQGHPVYIISYALLIFLFTYFYTAATFNTADVSDNLRKYGGFIPGLRPGRPTAEYLDKVLSRLTFSGALFLMLIALMPEAFGAASSVNLRFGGTSILIAVGVALDTMKQLESHLLMRHYQGFMK